MKFIMGKNCSNILSCVKEILYYVGIVFLCAQSVAYANSSDCVGQSHNQLEWSNKYIAPTSNGAIEAPLRYEISTGFDSILNIAWSPDGKYFAILGSMNKIASIAVYDSKSCDVIVTLDVKKSGIYSGDQPFVNGGAVAFSADGKLFAGGVGIISVWKTQDWKPVFDVLGPFSRGSHAADYVKSMMFSPNSKSLAVQYNRVILPESLHINTQLDLVAISKAKNYDRTIGNIPIVMVFELNNSTRRLFYVKPEVFDDVTNVFSGNVLFSPDGKYLLIGRVESIVGDKISVNDDPTKKFTFLSFYNALDGSLVKEIPNVHSMKVEAIAFNANGSIVATGSNTTSRESIINGISKKWYKLVNLDPIKLWDVPSGKIIKEFGPLPGGVRSLIFAQNDKILISCQTDSKNKETVWIWDVQTGTIAARVVTPRSGLDVLNCAVSPDGKNIVIPVDGVLYVVGVKNY